MKLRISHSWDLEIPSDSKIGDEFVLRGRLYETETRQTETTYRGGRRVPLENERTGTVAIHHIERVQE